MQETSTNGAGVGAAVEAAAAGREDQGGVAELGFVAGGRAAPEGVPDPELVEQAKRRSFTAEYKARILAEADAAGFVTVEIGTDQVAVAQQAFCILRALQAARACGSGIQPNRPPRFSHGLWPLT
jgi:hypothetical protein